MMKRTLNGFIAGIALVVALLSTSINVFAWENNKIIKKDFSINGNVKIKEGLDVILENID